jgi:hypothetical protein
MTRLFVEACASGDCSRCSRRTWARRDAPRRTKEERTKVREIMNWEAWQQRREEMVGKWN